MITDYFDKRANMEFSVPNDYETDIEKDPFYLKFDEDNNYWCIIYKNHPDFKNMPILNINNDKNKISIKPPMSPVKTDTIEIEIDDAHFNIENIESEWWIGHTRTGEDIRILRLFYITAFDCIYFADIDIDAEKNLFYLTLYGYHHDSINCVIKSSTHQSMFETGHLSIEIAL